MYNSIIVKYGEIGIKGKNRYIYSLSKCIRQFAICCG